MTQKITSFEQHSYDLRKIELEVRAAQAEAFRDMLSALATATGWLLKAPMMLWGRLNNRDTSVSRA